MERREFLRIAGIGTAGVVSLAAGCRSGTGTGAAPSPDAAAMDFAGFSPSDDELWRRVRSFYPPPPDYLDLDHANTAPTPRPVFDAFVERARRLSGAPAERFGKMWLDELDRVTRPAIAKYLGAEPRNVAFMPNTTTALNTVLHGFRLSPGDEILVTNHEYPDMIEAVLQRARREGIVVRKVAVPLPGEDRLELVSRVAGAITGRTKLLLISHISAWSGEILPVAEVTAAARARGVAVLVDAAQSVGIIDVDFDALGCDFLGASFHKGLGAPLPSGVLIMRPERMEQVWPLHPPSWDTTQYPTDRFEWSGTFNVAALATVHDALEFERAVGVERKRARLRQLAQRWQDQLRDVPGVVFLTPPEAERSCAAAAFAVERLPSKALAKHLRDARQILVQDKAGRHSPYANAIRVSPGAHTTIAEVDRFVAAVRDVVQSGISTTGSAA